MVGLCGSGRIVRSATGLCVGLALGSLLSGCILDNPKFDLDGTSSATGETSLGGSAGSESSSTGTSGGSETAGGTTTTGEPTTGEPTSGTLSTSTAATITDGTSTTSGSTSTTDDPTTDSEGSTGDMLCEEMDKIDVFLDVDMDGYGAGVPMTVCPDQIPAGYVELGGDCNDGNVNVKPGAIETCDGTDNNCNGLKDEYSESNVECELIDGPWDKDCFLSEYEGHFYYTCEAHRFPSVVNGLCSDFAVADGAKSYHVKIESPAENAEVESLAAALGEDVSIGLHDTVGFNQAKDHKWVEGDAELTYGKVLKEPPWGPGQPDKLLERWTQLGYQSGEWVDIGGDEARAFVCEAEPKG